MKLTTALISLVTIRGAYGGRSTASTKSSKSKSSKAICIEDSSLSFSLSLSFPSKSGKSSKSGKGHSLSYSTKSGKAHSLSYSSKSGKSESEVCLPCALGDLSDAPCGTNVGFCSFDYIDITCDTKACTPFCYLLEPICEPCEKGGLFGATCPQAQESTSCEISFNVDAEPTCVSSDCVIPVDIQCGPCKEAVPLGCPDVEGFCELDFQTLECVTCTDEVCPNLPLDQCSQPAGGARRLGVGNEKWGSKFELGLLGL